MKTATYFKSSLAIAVSGLAAQTGNAQVFHKTQNLTRIWEVGANPDVTFNITGGTTADYRFIYADNDPRKPQLTTSDFDGSGFNQIFLTDPASNIRTLPVLGEGTVVDSSLLGGNMLKEAFFYLNYDQNYFGDWGGAGGGPAATTGDNATPTAYPTGPVTGYVGLAIPTDANLTDFNYGYAYFTIDVVDAFDPTLPGASITLHRTAYEQTVNTPITIVPEPSVAALVMGALGVFGLRLRRARR